MTSGFYAYIVALVLVTCASNSRGANALKLQISTKRGIHKYQIHPGTEPVGVASDEEQEPRQSTCSLKGGARYMAKFLRRAVGHARPNSDVVKVAPGPVPLPNVPAVVEDVAPSSSDKGASSSRSAATSSKAPAPPLVTYVVPFSAHEPGDGNDETECTMCLGGREDGVHLAFSFVKKSGKQACCAGAGVCRECAVDLLKSAKGKADNSSSSHPDDSDVVRSSGKQKQCSCSGPPTRSSNSHTQFCPNCRGAAKLVAANSRAFNRKIGEGLAGWKLNPDEMREDESWSDLLYRVQALQSASASTSHFTSDDPILDILEREMVRLAANRDISRNDILRMTYKWYAWARHYVEDFEYVDELTGRKKTGYLLRVPPQTGPGYGTHGHPGTDRRYTGAIPEYYFYGDLLLDIIAALHPSKRAGRQVSKTGIPSKLVQEV